MDARNRREFLSQVGQGMLVAAVGFSTALELDLAPAFAAGMEDAERLRFGALEPLVQVLQETDAEKLLPLCVQKLSSGTPLKTLVAAAALANARTFGGQDYIGFHTIMAMTPSLRMAQWLPSHQQALPVLKVVHRNSRRIQEHGGPGSEVLHPVPIDNSLSDADGEMLRDAVRAVDMDKAERVFARIAAGGSVDQMFNELLVAVQDESEVHRVVLPYRARDLVNVVGAEHAHTMLRQSVRYCVNSESPGYRESCKGGRDVLPKLLDTYRLLEPRENRRTAEDAFMESLANSIFGSNPEAAAEAVASALAEGFAFEAIGEAISLAANQLVLRDAGRPPEQARPPEKPPGSIHGDSIGVHASDSANAWRNMSKYGNARNRVACLILGAYQVAHDRISRGGDFLTWQPYPTSEHLERIRGKSPDGLLAQAEAAIRDNDQALAAAAVYGFGKSGGSPDQVFSLMLKYAISEDGALHAEKYFATVSDDFAATRASLRWRHLAGLARVTASSFGFPAPGVAEAERLLGG